MEKLLIIDDEKDLRLLLQRLLQREGYEVATAADAESAWRAFEKHEIGVVLTDVRLPDADGVDLTIDIKERFPDTEVICLTAHATVADGVRAIKNGAFDYLIKLDDNERIIPMVGKAMEKARLQHQLRRLRAQLSGEAGFDKIIGQSASLQQAVALARQVAPADTTVLLTGETGTGKEVFARAIHAESPRRSEAFVAVNCSALGRELLESELFGYRAGAFTGATRDKKGLFEEAHRGAIFLDEIGELEPDLQAKLLRVLENGTFFKIGETQERRVDVRVIAATNRSLEKEVEKGRFREDLYYRLSVFRIHLPGLDQRREDIPLFARYFADVFAGKLNKKISRLSDAFVAALQRHHWRGNVRELRNVMERAVLLAAGDTITPDLLPFDFEAGPEPAGAYPPTLSLADVERRHILLVLRHAGGNKTHAARILGIGLTTLYTKLREYGVPEE